MSHKKVERIDPLTQALPCVGCDSHAHLDGEEFDADREEVLARARAAGVATIGNIFLHPDTWRQKRAYFNAHPEVFFVLGIHPCDVISPEEIKAHSGSVAELGAWLKSKTYELKKLK